MRKTKKKIDKSELGVSLPIMAPFLPWDKTTTTEALAESCSSR